MIGLVMAGGKGSRMDSSNEKLLLVYKKPIVLHVIDALMNSQCFEKIFAITSNNSPKTRELLHASGIQTIDTSGDGYVQDLNHVLSSINDIVFVTSGDLPLLDADVIKKIISVYDPNQIWTSVLVTKEFLNSLHLSSDLTINFANKICHYSGISMINANLISDIKSVKESFVILDDKRIAFNLNTFRDFELLGAS